MKRAAVRIQDTTSADPLAEFRGDGAGTVTALSAAHHDPGLAENPQVFGNVVGGGVDAGGQYFDNSLAVEELVDDVQPGGIGQGFK